MNFWLFSPILKDILGPNPIQENELSGFTFLTSPPTYKIGTEPPSLPPIQSHEPQRYVRNGMNLSPITVLQKAGTEAGDICLHMQWWWLTELMAQDFDVPQRPQNCSGGSTTKTKAWKRERGSTRLISRASELAGTLSPYRH